jgi:hypothetical protein
MMEYFAYKKYKKNKTEKEEKVKHDKNPEESAENGKGKGKDQGLSTPPKKPPAAHAPVLTEDDESFFQSIISDDGPAPPLPPRVKTPELTWEHSDDERSRKSVQLYDGKEKENDHGKGEAAAKKETAVSKATNRLSTLFRSATTKKKHTANTLAPPNANDPLVSESEAEREKRDMTRVLDDLNLSAKNNKAFSLSQESNELVGKFTLVLKDLVNGVPTAADDLMALIEDRDGILAKNFDKLPKSLKKLVTQLPSKMTSGLAPEILAAAAEAQGLKHDEEGGGLKGAAKKLLMPGNLQELITKPGAVVGMLRAIMNALKLRWPAFIGTNVLWSVALFCKLIQPTNLIRG